MIKFGSLKIDPIALGSQGNAVLGIRGSGKTYTATYLAEQIDDAGIPFIAFDPIGVWRFMKRPGAGKGYPVIVAGGVEGDLPLTVASAPEIVRAAMANGLSLVIDLFDINLSKADWKRIVTACVKVLLHENSQHGLRHIFIEEAAEFAPQRVGPDQGAVYAEIEKLARMGGNSRLGYTLINQRAEEVNKAVLELCDNLFLHRQKGRNSLTALGKWLDIGNADNAKEIVASMATLPTGECWAWLGESSLPVRIKVPTKNSLHPDRTIMRGDVSIDSAKPVDVAVWVTTMRESLAKFTAEFEANDPKRLKAEIERLKKLAAEPQQIVTQVKGHTDEEMAAEYARGRADGYDHGVAQGQFLAFGNARDRLIEVVGQFDASAERYSEQALAFGDRPSKSNTAPKLHTAAKPAPIVAQAARPIIVANGPRQGIADLGAERKPLAVLVSIYPGGLTEAQWSQIAGFKRTGGTWGTYKSRLRTAGRIEERGDLWFATEQGVADIGEDLPQLPEPGPALVEFWCGKLGAESKFLKALADIYPEVMTRDELAAQFEMTPSGGTFGTYLSRLRSNGLIEDTKTTLRAAPSLMERA